MFNTNTTLDAYTTELLVPDTDYVPRWVSGSKILGTWESLKKNGPGRFDRCPIFKFKVLTNDYSGNMSIWSYGNLGEEAVIIPKKALRVGQTYNFYLKKFSGTGITLLGYATRFIPEDTDGKPVYYNTSYLVDGDGNIIILDPDGDALELDLTF